MEVKLGRLKIRSTLLFAYGREKWNYKLRSCIGSKKECVSKRDIEAGQEWGFQMIEVDLRYFYSLRPILVYDCNHQNVLNFSIKIKCVPKLLIEKNTSSGTEEKVSLSAQVLIKVRSF